MQYIQQLELLLQLDAIQRQLSTVFSIKLFEFLNELFQPQVRDLCFVPQYVLQLILELDLQLDAPLVTMKIKNPLNTLITVYKMHKTVD